MTKVSGPTIGLVMNHALSCLQPSSCLPCHPSTSSTLSLIGSSSKSTSATMTSSSVDSLPCSRSPLRDRAAVYVNHVSSGSSSSGSGSSGDWWSSAKSCPPPNALAPFSPDKAAPKENKKSRMFPFELIYKFRNRSTSKSSSISDGAVSPVPEEYIKWAKVLYFEFGKIIGSPYETSLREFRVTGHKSQNEGFCLANTSMRKRSQSTAQVFMQMGDGVKFSRRSDSDEVYFENKCPVFVQSALMSYVQKKDPRTVYEMQQLNSMCIFRLEALRELIAAEIEQGVKDLEDLQRYCVARVSFGTGWGEQFRDAPTTESVPVMIEVIFEEGCKLIEAVEHGLREGLSPSDLINGFRRYPHGDPPPRRKLNSMSALTTMTTLPSSSGESF